MIRNFLDLSTSHVSKETASWLDAQGLIAAQCLTAESARPEIHMGRTIHGWFVYADEENASGTIPDDLFAVLRHARAQDCDYVLFDCDGDTIEGLAIFDW